MKKLLLQHTSVHQFTGAIFAMLFILVVTSFSYNTLSSTLEQSEIRFYQTASISEFYTVEYITPDDVCVGDSFQTCTSKRRVYNTEKGWNSDIAIELFQTSPTFVKRYDEFRSPFIEFRDGKEGSRIQLIPSDLPVGEYLWAINVSLKLPKGVIRNDVPLIYSDPFLVKECNI